MGGTDMAFPIPGLPPPEELLNTIRIVINNQLYKHYCSLAVPEQPKIRYVLKCEIVDPSKPVQLTLFN